MKVKQVGNIPEKGSEEIHKDSSERIPEPEPVNTGSAKIEAPEEQKAATTNTARNKYLIFGLGGLALVVIAVLLYIFVFSKGDDTTVTTTKTDQNMPDDLKKKELELKERELKLKEQELNKQSTTSNTQSGSQSNYPVEAENQVKKWINALGSRDYSTAYYLMSKSKRGDYSKFSSIKGYGGITSTSIFSCATESSAGCTAEVVAVYEAIDPSNRSGKYNQKFFLNNCSGTWEITDTKTLNINFY